MGRLQPGPEGGWKGAVSCPSCPVGLGPAKQGRCGMTPPAPKGIYLPVRLLALHGEDVSAPDTPQRGLAIECGLVSQEPGNTQLQ